MAVIKTHTGFFCRVVVGVVGRVLAVHRGYVRLHVARGEVSSWCCLLLPFGLVSSVFLIELEMPGFKEKNENNSITSRTR